MAVEPASIQLRREKQLFTQLSNDNGVKKGIARYHELASGWGFGHRRDLLTGALRLNRTISPEIADSLAACREIIGFHRPVEIYVRPEPMINACCMKNPTGPVLVVVSSRMIEVFTPAELRFVIGHELGHAAFDHFSIPMPVIAKIEDMGVQYVSHKTSLDLYVWCRAAELSADRVGMVCAQDPVAAASGFFKCASGLSSDRVHADLEMYSRQVESLASAPSARSEPRDDDDTLDCFSTHPYSPVRVRAAVAFSKSENYLKAIGKSTAGTQLLSDDDIDAIIERDLAMMQPSYLEEKSSNSDILKRVLFSGGITIAAAASGIDDRELEAITALLGKDYDAKRTSPETAKKDLEGRIKEAVEKTSLAERAQLVQHLTIVAAADGVVEPEEVAEMHRIATGLGVDVMVIEQTLRGAAMPMD